MGQSYRTCVARGLQRQPSGEGKRNGMVLAYGGILSATADGESPLSPKRSGLLLTCLVECCMLRLHQQSSPDAAKAYYATAAYYTENQELVGEWGGKGAARLGLGGVVDHEAFNSLCDNRDPGSGKQLTPRTRSDRTVGYDFTFDGPKSVSVLYSLTGDQSILQAFRDSVQETMTEIEQDMHTRVRSRGRNENRQTGNMLWAEFVHFT